MSQIKIVYTDGTEKKEYCWENSFRIKDGMLIISKGRHESSLYVNLQHVKEFKECEG